MNDKFTIRDFFAYFLSGCAFFIALTIADFDNVICFLQQQKDDIKEYSALIIFASLPSLYFTGQFIQCVDTILYGIGNKIWKRYLKKPSVCKKGLYYLVASHRISGTLNLNNISTKEFWDKCNELELASKYGHSEYWYIMNDLFKAITLINLFFLGYSFWFHHWVKGFVFLLTSLLFWYRAKYYALLFTQTVESARRALEYIKPQNVGKSG